MRISLRRHGRGLGEWLQPWRCQLCAGAGEQGVDLCAACNVDIPRNKRCCARCALPLPESSPLCGRCLKRLPTWTSAWAPFRYAWPLDHLELRYKFAGDLAVGRTLSRVWQGEGRPPALPQLLLPVPLHRSRLRQRGFNQALELCRPLAHAWRVPLNAERLCRLRATNAQTELDAVARRRNVRGAFELRGSDALPAHIALVDDVMTTGATLEECARVIRRAGVNRIDVWVLARAPMSQRAG